MKASAQTQLNPDPANPDAPDKSRTGPPATRPSSTPEIPPGPPPTAPTFFQNANHHNPIAMRPLGYLNADDLHRHPRRTPTGPAMVSM